MTIEEHGFEDMERDTWMPDGEPAQEAGEGCGAARALLHAYIEGEVDPIRSRIVEEHLASCAACREAGRAIEEERLWFIETALKSPPLSDRFAEKVTRKIRLRARAEASARRRAWKLRGAAAAALLCAAVIGARVSVGPRPDLASSPAGDLPTAPTGTTGPDIDPSPQPAVHEHIRLAALESSARPAAPGHAPEGTAPGARMISVRITSGAVERIRDDAGGEGEILVSSPARRHAIARNVNEMWWIVIQTSPASWGVPRDPCAPDPNRDGKTDIKDVAYSCQVIMGTPPVGLADEGAASEEKTHSESDCDEHCLSA